MSAFDDLLARCRRIELLLTEAKSARDLPARRVNDVRRIQFTTSGYDRMTEAQHAIAKRMREMAEAEERRQGEIARDRELKRLATEMDRLRADLVDLASEARFDLCDAAREMRS